MKRLISYVAIAALCVVVVVHAGKIVKMVQEKKVELEAKRAELVAKRIELTAVHTELNKDLLGKLTEVISGPSTGPMPPLDTVITQIVASKSAIKNIPSAGLTFAGIGDISDTLNAIEDVLASTKTVLQNVKARFEPIIHSLSPVADPKGIYKGFDSAIADMNKTLDELLRFENFVTKLGL